METLAPAVVAVIVTCDPGPWFDETLSAFAAQEYPELSVLVLDAHSSEDPTARVASVLPGAFVRRLDENRGFGAAANEVLTMVEGASHYLFCHDDVAPAPDVVHLLVEESYRSNAAIVAPKLVSWDDPERLLHVGMAVDKGGAVVDRVDPYEIDHGQHDAVRDVFLVPGGCTLVRADLFAELGGFDSDIFAMGEDLDLCWRAQVAGARVVVAPQARVRHLEMLASGRRRLPDSVQGTAPGEPLVTSMGAAGEATAGEQIHEGVPRTTLQGLQRRHELHVALKTYGPFHLARVLPQLILLSSAECVLALASGHRDRASAVAGAWRWNLARRRELRSERAAVRASRVLDDADVRRLQLHGSARLNAYVRRAVTHGLSAAHRGAKADAESVAGHQAMHDRRAAATGQGWRLGVWAAVVLVLVFGSRQLLGSGFPYVGQLLPLPSAGSLLHRFLSGWQPAGVGTTDPTSPVTGMLGLAGVVLFGGVGLLQKIVVLGCLPAGAFGMSRLVRPLGSRRARMASVVVYLAAPLAYDALAMGRWDGLLAYAACPWVVACLARAAGCEPFGVQTPQGAGAVATRRWRTSLTGRALSLGVIDAVLVAAAPSAALLVGVVAAGLVVGLLVSDGRQALRPVGRVVVVAVGATAIAFVLLAPWSVAALAGPDRWQELAGLATTPSTAPSWGALLRLAVGPIGDTPLAWAFLVSAALPLVIGARWRLAWAGRAWVLALVAWTLIWVSGHGWLGPVVLSPQVFLVPAGVAVALAVGLGVAAFETDLPGYRFGWRQGSAVIAAAAAVVGVTPVLLASVNGRWDLPSTGYGEATSWMRADAYRGDFRVLWLADPRVLPGGGWQLAPGLAYSVSEDGLGDATEMWSGSAPGAATRIGDGVRLAQQGSTVQLGRLLAPYAVRYVVVVDSLAPSIPGFQAPAVEEPPPDLEPALRSQLDLQQIISEGGIEVFVDDAALPERAVRPGAPGVPTSVTASLSGWRPVLHTTPGATAATGRVPAGTLVAAVAPSGSWQMVEPGGRVSPAREAFGFAASFEVARPGVVTVRYRGSWSHGLEILAEVLLWIVAALVLVGRRWSVDWWWPRLQRRRPWARRGGQAGADAPTASDPSVVGAADAPTVGAPDGTVSSARVSR